MKIDEYGGNNFNKIDQKKIYNEYKGLKQKTIKMLISMLNRKMQNLDDVFKESWRERKMIKLSNINKTLIKKYTKIVLL